MELGIILAISAAALALILPSIGSAIALSVVGRSATGLMAEEPEKFGKALLLQVLPGTQGIYGFLAAVLVMEAIGMFGEETVAVSTDVGWQIFLAVLPIAFMGIISSILQGKVSLAGISMLTKRAEEAGKAIILSAMVETYAVIALLLTILLLNVIEV